MASSRLLLSMGHDHDDSDDDFIPPRRMRSSAGESSGTSSSQVQLASASERVNRAVQRGLSLVRNKPKHQPAELGDRFPFLNRGKRANLGRQKSHSKHITWKTVPCCLSGPHVTRVPSKAILDGLCREGLGTLWFTKDQELLELDLLDVREFHFMIICLYPCLKNVPYEIC